MYSYEMQIPMSKSCVAFVTANDPARVKADARLIIESASPSILAGGTDLIVAVYGKRAVQMNDDRLTHNRTVSVWTEENTQIPLRSIIARGLEGAGRNGIESIVMGTPAHELSGTDFSRPASQMAAELVAGLTQYLEQNPNSPIKRVAFAAGRDSELRQEIEKSLKAR
jgi:hypothetical protein